MQTLRGSPYVLIVLAADTCHIGMYRRTKPAYKRKRTKAISYAVGFVSRKRPFSSDEAQIELPSYAVEKGLFRHNFFRLRHPTGGSSRETQSKKFHMCFFNRSHRSSHHRTHTYTATRPHTRNNRVFGKMGTEPEMRTETCTRYHTAVSYKALTLAWLSQLLLLAASQRGAFLSMLASSVYHTTAAARGLDPMLPTTVAAAVALAALGWVQLHERSFGGFRLSPKPPSRWDKGSPSRCSRRKREAQSYQRISPAVHQYSLTRTASRKSTKTIKSTRLTIRRRTIRISRKKVQSKRAVLDWRNRTV